MAYTLQDAIRDAEKIKNYMGDFAESRYVKKFDMSYRALEDYRNVRDSAEDLYDKLVILSEDYMIKEEK